MRAYRASLGANRIFLTSRRHNHRTSQRQNYARAQGKCWGQLSLKLQRMAQNCYFCQSPPRRDVDIVGWRTAAGFKVQVGRPDILIGTNPHPPGLKVKTRGEMATAV